MMIKKVVNFPHQQLILSSCFRTSVTLATTTTIAKRRRRRRSLLRRKRSQSTFISHRIDEIICIIVLLADPLEAVRGKAEEEEEDA